MFSEIRTAFFSNIFAFAILAGSSCVICSSAIDDLFMGFIAEKSGINVRSTVIKCVVLGFTAGPLLGVIFYAFSRTSSEPVKTAFIYSTLFGIVSPVICQLVFIFCSKLFSRKSE